jgi:hypothetical protein
LVNIDTSWARRQVVLDERQATLYTILRWTVEFVKHQLNKIIVMFYTLTIPQNARGLVSNMYLIKSNSSHDKHTS